MRRMIVIMLLPVLMLSSVVLLRTDVQAAPPSDPGRSEHERVVRYWTPDRVAGARPRDFDRPLAPQAKPGGGGGGGGSSTTAVKGAAWTGGGLVKLTTGRVLFTLSGVDYVCSGSVVSDGNTAGATSLVLTAGHCVYDDAADVFAMNWMFVPDYGAARTFNCDAASFGCWTAQSLVTTSAWQNGDFNEDYAFAVVGPGGKTGQLNQLDATVGAQEISFLLSHPREVFAFGYPVAKKYTGQTLIYCSGTTVADTFGGSTDYGLACDMTGGSSGGPWLANFDRTTGRGTLTSVNSFKYYALSQYMFGPYFDAYGQKTYDAALAATGNTLVTP